MKRDERVAAVKISSDSRKVAQKFWAPQQDHRPLRDCNRKCGTSPGGRTGASAPTGWLQLKTPPMPAGMRGEKIRGSTLVCHSMGAFYARPGGGHLHPPRSRTHFPRRFTGRLAAGDRPSLRKAVARTLSDRRAIRLYFIVADFPLPVKASSPKTRISAET